MENGPISVVEIQTPEQLLVIAKETKRPLIDLGGKHSTKARKLEEHIRQLQDTLREGAKRVFTLSWTGHKVPSGAKVLDHVIGWTQNGQVVSEAGKYIGTYDRIVEFGGWDKNQHELVLYLFKK